ncbi:MAG: hypothetical protein IJP92_00915 [Lachnospiraceae bacterium]|nr:hypothetical protein [Lachnospiraceae bacterium]
MRTKHFMIWFAKKDGSEDWDYIKAPHRYAAIHQIEGREDFDYITDVTEIDPMDDDDSYLAWTWEREGMA